MEYFLFLYALITGLMLGFGIAGLVVHLIIKYQHKQLTKEVYSNKLLSVVKHNLKGK